jgi:hypothetical protein
MNNNGENKTPTDPLKALVERREKINARIQQLNARRATTERRRDTRRKIIVGAIILAAVEREPKLQQWLQVQIGRLARPQDRALFQIPNVGETDVP